MYWLPVMSVTFLVASFLSGAISRRGQRAVMRAVHVDDEF
jgi:hypothetical protein